MDISETYIKLCEKAGEIQDIKRYKAFSITSPSAEALILDDHDFYGVHEVGQYYPDSTIGSHNVWNATVFGYVSNVPQFGCAVDKNRRIKYKVNEVIWLPRQDQLQEMLRDKYSLMEMATYFWEYLADGWGQGDTMEQLWLAFCMSEKYGKVWSGTEWIKK